MEVSGRLDFCFNAAGISGALGAIADQSTDNLDSVLKPNLNGVWFCEESQTRQMMKRDMRPLRLVL